MQTRPIEGQRFFLDSEPDLGLGIVVAVKGRQFEIFFPGAETVRMYSVDTAPVTRAYYRTGDTILVEDEDGAIARETIREVHNEDGLYFYTTQQREFFPETKLSSRLGSASPVTRLLNGQVDHSKLFELRAATIQAQAAYQSSNLQGLLGARAELLPHQLYVAKTTLQSERVRVMLADEVGLGKTIEAGYIASHLLRTERVSRISFCVPQPLLMQWFIELVRRFQIAPVIWNEGTHEDAAIRLISYDDLPVQDWSELDLLIVDEAHHIASDSAHFTSLDAAAQQVDHLVLLSATPAQMGDESHLQRMRLLDYGSKGDGAQQAGQTASRLLECIETALKEERYDWLASKLDVSSDANVDAAPDGSADSSLDGSPAEPSVQAVIDKALSMSAPTLKLKRNRRANISGFPIRQIAPCFINKTLADPVSSESVELSAIDPVESAVDSCEAGEYNPLASQPNSDTGDSAPNGEELSPRLPDLALRVERAASLIAEANSSRKSTKWLLIVHAKQDAIAAKNLLDQHRQLQGLGLATTVFHEGLDLIERDRAAAWFTEPDGAQILVCSEIGSEGRNFQACSRLICLDLPPSPDLLEQRIGRIDRIGQRSQIVSIYLILKGSDNAGGLDGSRACRDSDFLLYQWYRHILSSLDRYNPIAAELHSVYWPKLLQDAQGQSILLSVPLSEAKPTTDFSVSSLLKEVCSERIRQLAIRDRENRALVDLNSLREPAASELLAQIDEFSSNTPQALIEALSAEFNLHFEWIRENIYSIMPSDDMMIDHIPGIPEDGAEITFSRETALGREDILFVGWDSPLVEGMFDLISLQDFGRASMMLFPAPKLPQGKMILESHFRLVVRHRAKHKLSAYLPRLLERIVFMQDFAGELSAKLPYLSSESLKTLPRARAREAAVLLRPVISSLENKAQAEAMVRLDTVYANLTQALENDYKAKLDELDSLAQDMQKALRAFNLPDDDLALKGVLAKRDALVGERDDLLRVLENKENGVISLELSSVRALLTTS